jgi:rod shape-determining protein MreD
MVDPRAFRRFLYRLLFLGLCGGLVFLHVLPVDLSAGRWPGPDLMICLTFAWALRRPRFVPVLMIAAVFLAADLIYMRPPGLWAALVVLGVEYLRAQEAQTRDLPFPNEWALVAAVLTGITVLNSLVLWVTVVGQPSLGMILIELIFTLLAYPAVVFVSSVLLGVRKIAPGELESIRGAA